VPQRFWKHFCPNYNCETSTGSAVCCSCGQKGEYVGWGYSIIEAMAAYQQRTGLKPAGPHRTMADELLGPLFRVCDVCGGKELLTIAGGSDWKDCPACAGNCCVPTASKAAWEEARRQVLCIFPDADVKWNA